MKLLSVLLMSLLLVAAPVTFTGCQTGSGMSENATVFQTLKGTQILVDNAMQAYGTAVVQGGVSVEKQVEIDALHGRYREAFRLAVTAARADLNALTPADVAALANQITLLISQL